MIPTLPVEWRQKGCGLAKSDSGKIKQIHKLVNQFASSLRHRPFANELDKARTLGFIHTLRDVITSHGSKPIMKPKVYQVELIEPASKEKQAEYIKEAKQKIRSNNEEPVSKKRRSTASDIPD